MIARPEWPAPLPSRRFVHRIGVIARRRRENLEESPGDDVFCTANRAIRLPSPKPVIQVDEGTDARKLRLECAFRRLFNDGTSLCRFEMGWGCRHDEKEPFTRDFKSIAADLLDHQGVVGADTKARAIASAGPSLAKLLVRASQSAKKEKIIEGGVEARRPMLLLAVHSAAPTAVAGLRELNWQEPNDALPRVFLGTIETRADVWRLAVLVGGTPELARNVRLSLLRLHAEIEAVRFVAAEVVSGRLEFKATGRSGKLLLGFFEGKAESLFRHDYGGAPVRPLLVMLAQGDKDLQAFNLKAAESLETQASKQIEIACKLTKRIEIVKITQKGKGSNFGPVIVGSTITNSLINTSNKISGVAQPDLKELLGKLHEAAEKAIAALPAAEQEAAAAQLDRLVDESSRAKPDKKFWELSRDGLLEATKTVAEMVPTLIPVAVSIAKLLFG